MDRYLGENGKSELQNFGGFYLMWLCALRVLECSSSIEFSVLSLSLSLSLSLYIYIYIYIYKRLINFIIFYK